jgi:hypothetical protein
MNNYLLAGHLLKCVYLPAEKTHPLLFKGSERKFKKIPWQKLEQKRREKVIIYRDSCFGDIFETQAIYRNFLAEVGKAISTSCEPPYQERH